MRAVRDVIASSHQKRLRCAIYTRKSSEEGLEQDFNSLQAQREACEAYILSQRHEGWVALPAHYNDGGFSGGSMGRPALLQLLADVSAGLVDVVVVYKVDRLTRSLADFAKIVETFDAQSVSFVSVTQSFNTTSSMGRLTLNVLLSFAQFEREVTGERIRDKIAASKKKGLWMGGFVPIGYLADGRTLKIDEASAPLIRSVFARYLALGSVADLHRALAGEGVTTRKFVSAKGRGWGGLPFGKGHLKQILSNPIYAGEIAHAGKRFAGQHSALIEHAQFSQVQVMLASRQSERITRINARSPHLLSGLLVDEAGRRLVGTHANKKGRRYRYYVGKALSEGDINRTDANSLGVTKRMKLRRLRLPAAEIEELVLLSLMTWLGDPSWRMAHLADVTATPYDLERIEHAAIALRERLQSLDQATRRAALLALVSDIRIEEDILHLTLKTAMLLSGTHNDPPQNIMTTIALRRNVQRRLLRLVVPEADGSANPIHLDKPLIKAIARGVTWYEDLKSGQMASIRDIAAAEQVSERFIGQHMRLALLAPDLIEGVLSGAVPLAITTTQVAQGLDLPVKWQDQREMVTSV